MKKDNPKAEKEIRIKASFFAFAVSAALSMILLCATVSDCKKYESDSVTVALTYTPPERQREYGFWDIFTDCIAGLFFRGEP